jgi:hypothetical protein
MSPGQITNHMQGYIMHSEQLTRGSRLKEVVSREKSFETVIYKENKWNHFGRHE